MLGTGKELQRQREMEKQKQRSDDGQPWPGPSPTQDARYLVCSHINTVKVAKTLSALDVDGEVFPNMSRTPADSARLRAAAD